MAEACLLDTNFVSALWDALHQQHTLARDYLRKHPDWTVYVSVISIAEIEYGLRTAPNIDPERQNGVRRSLEAFPLILDISLHTVESYAELRAALFQHYSPRDRKGRLTAKRPEELAERTTSRELGIQENDLWIAATASERNLILVSDDRMSRIREVCPVLRFDQWKTSAIPA